MVFSFVDSFLLVFQISEKLKSMGLESDKMSWIQRGGEEVFHLESKHTANSNNQCNRQ